MLISEKSENVFYPIFTFGQIKTNKNKSFNVFNFILLIYLF